jgi:hypothetical protein
VCKRAGCRHDEARGPSEIAADSRTRDFQFLGLVPLAVEGLCKISVPEFSKARGEKGTPLWQDWLARNLNPAL